MIENETMTDKEARYLALKIAYELIQDGSFLDFIQYKNSKNNILYENWYHIMEKYINWRKEWKQ